MHNLPISFKDKEYIIVGNSGNMSRDTNISLQGETATTFSVKNLSGALNKVYWYAIGY